MLISADSGNDLDGGVSLGSPNPCYLSSKLLSKLTAKCRLIMIKPACLITLALHTMSRVKSKYKLCDVHHKDPTNLGVIVVDDAGA